MKAFLIIPSLLLLLLPIEPQQPESKSSRQLYAMKITFQKYGEAYPLFTVLQSSRDGRVRGGFSRLSPDRMMQGAVPENDRVSSIEGSAELVEEKWVVNFSVIVGPLVDQEPQRIASYQLSLGESALVKELSQFQIEPFSVSIVKVSTTPAGEPPVLNDTRSIEVTRVGVSLLPLPYTIRLKNLSNKSVRALHVETLSRTGGGSPVYFRASGDRPLIDPQGSYETLLLSSGSYRKIAPNEYVPTQLEQIHVGGVLFTDWTYEGDPSVAAVEIARTTGERQQIKRALKLIESALTNPGSTPQDLIAAAEMLRNGVSSSALVELKDKFPTLNSPEVNLIPTAIQTSRDVKAALIAEIQKLQATSATTDSVDFQTWLRSQKTKYERRLSNLQ